MNYRSKINKPDHSKWWVDLRENFYYSKLHNLRLTFNSIFSKWVREGSWNETIQLLWGMSDIKKKSKYLTLDYLLVTKLQLTKKVQ